MLDLTYEKTIHIDKWDIDVVPYLSVEEMGYIINDLLTCENGLERDMKLIADVLVACTDLYNQSEDGDEGSCSKTLCYQCGQTYLGDSPCKNDIEESKDRTTFVTFCSRNFRIFFLIFLIINYFKYSATR